MQQAPKAPTIADLLGQRQAAPVTSAQDEARRMFAERMSAIRGTTSLPQALSDVGGHIANAIMARKDMARAKETDQAATAAEGERRQHIAEMLTGAGYSPEQAVGFATASPDETALVASLTGMKRQEQAAADDRAWRESQAAVDADQFAQNLALKRQQFDADQALKQKALQQSEQDRALARQQSIARQGHLEDIAGRLPEDQRSLFWANPEGFLSKQSDDFSTEVSRILAANPELAQSPEGVRQAQNVALGLVKSATDPVRGGTATYNVATGQGAPIETPTPSLEPFGADGSPISIDQMAGEVGAIPFAEDVIARTVGQAAPSLVNEARTKAASQLDFLKQKAVTAFATSARPPVIEQQRIAALFPSKGIFDSEARASQQLGHLRDLAVATHDDYIGLINSGQLPFDQENELRGKVAELRQVVNMLPERADSAMPSPSVDLGDDPLGLFSQ